MADGPLSRGLVQGLQIRQQQQQINQRQQQVESQRKQQEFTNAVSGVKLLTELGLEGEAQGFLDTIQGTLGITIDPTAIGKDRKAFLQDVKTLEGTMVELEADPTKASVVKTALGAFGRKYSGTKAFGDRAEAIVGGGEQAIAGAEQLNVGQALEIENLRQTRPDLFEAGGGAQAQRVLLQAGGAEGQKLLAKQLTPETGRQRARTESLIAPDGKVHKFQFNSKTGRFDIDLGLAPRSITDDLRVTTFKTNIANNFNADPAVRKGQQRIDFGNTIIDAADSDNPVAHAALPTLMARASGEVGNLSEADKKPFGGSRALTSRIAQASKELADGKRTEENINFIKELAGIFVKSGDDVKVRLAKERSKQFARANDLLEEDEILEFLAPQFVLNQAKGNKDALKSKYGLE